jgi:hypothetical protein
MDYITHISNVNVRWYFEKEIEKTLRAYSVVSHLYGMGPYEYGIPLVNIVGIHIGGKIDGEKTN